MRVLQASIVVCALPIAVATAVAENATSQLPHLGDARLIGDPNPADGRPRPSYVVIGDPQPLPPPGDEVLDHAAPKIFFMNKGGGTYTPGTNDARTNRSTIVGQTRQVPAWNVSAAGWSQVMGCMTTLFSRWNVVITDVDPGPSVAHFEIVVAGEPQDIGMQQGVGGVSPFACSPINNSIVFAFAEVYGTAYRDICETAAQEIAHSFSLDHENLCQDPMTYKTGCGNKSFQNVAAPCGEYSNRACMCGGSTQNSVALLDQRLGLYEPQPAVDAGPSPAVDAGVDAPSAVVDGGGGMPIDAALPVPDGGDPVPPGADGGGNPAEGDAGAAGDERISGGCGCASGPGGRAVPPNGLLLAMAVFVGLGRRRRRTLAQP